MPNTLDWKSSEDPRDIVHLIVQALVEGRIVVLPAETAYHAFASGLKESAVERLTSLDCVQQRTRPTLFLRSSSEALDYAPELSSVASRLVGRGWPGPLVLELPAANERSLSKFLPTGTRNRLLRDDQFVGMRVAAHEAIRQAMRLMPGPLVAMPLQDQQSEPVCRGEQLQKVSSSAISMLVADGPTHFGGLATTVRVRENRCRVMHDGVLAGESLLRLGQFVVLLVCTGNTCRSPMAETLLKAKLRERFPSFADLPFSPVAVSSAGLSAFPGGPASPEAISVMKRRGLSLVDHQSRALTERTLRNADLILAMTNSHRSAIVDRMPEIASRVHLVSGSRQDVSDPFGGPETVYMECAEQIDQYLNRWIDQFDESWFAVWESD